MKFETYLLYGPSFVDNTYQPHYLAQFNRSQVGEDVWKNLSKMPLKIWKELQWKSVIMALFASSVSVGCAYLKHQWKTIPMGANVVTIGTGGVLAIIGTASVVRAVQAHLSIRQLHKLFKDS